MPVTRPTPHRRAVATLAGALVVALALSACLPAPFSPPVPPRQPLWPAELGRSYAVGVLTRDGTDRYSLDLTATGVDVHAEDANVGGDTRVVLWRHGVPEVTDGETCATWGPRRGDTVQQGAALRVTRAGGVLRAVTITQNVWVSPYTFNVHTWDTSRPGVPHRRVGRILMEDRFFAFGIPELPWRFCARAVGDDVGLKIWTQAEEEPSWSDPAHSGHVTLPVGWERPGQFGWYVGHLRAGEHASYRDLSSWVYDPVQRMTPRLGRGTPRASGPGR